MGYTSNYVMNGIWQGVADYLNNRLADRREEKRYQKSRQRKRNEALEDAQTEEEVRNANPYNMAKRDAEKSGYDATTKRNLVSQNESNRQLDNEENLDKLYQLKLSSDINSYDTANKIAEYLNSPEMVDLKKNTLKSGYESDVEKNKASKEQSIYNQDNLKMLSKLLPMQGEFGKLKLSNDILSQQLARKIMPLASSVQKQSLESQFLQNALYHELIPAIMANKKLEVGNTRNKLQLEKMIQDSPEFEKVFTDSMLGRTYGDNSGGGKNGGDYKVKNIIEALNTIVTTRKGNVNPEGGFYSNDIEKDTAAAILILVDELLSQNGQGQNGELGAGTLKNILEAAQDNDQAFQSETPLIKLK